MKFLSAAGLLVILFGPVPIVFAVAPNRPAGDSYLSGMQRSESQSSKFSQKNGANIYNAYGYSYNVSYQSGQVSYKASQTMQSINTDADTTDSSEIKSRQHFSNSGAYKKPPTANEIPKPTKLPF